MSEPTLSQVIQNHLAETLATPPSPAPAPPGVPPPPVEGAPVAALTPPAPQPDHALIEQLLSEPEAHGTAPVVESVAANGASASPAPAPAPVDIAAILEAQDRKFQALIQTLRPAPAPTAEPDISLELPAHMRTPENIETYRIMKETARREAEAVRQEWKKSQEEAQFHGQIQAARQDALQTAQRVAQQIGVNPTTPGGQKVVQNLATMGLSLSAAKGGNPSDHAGALAQMLRDSAREMLQARVAQARTRQSLQAPTHMAPPVSGPPGAPPTGKVPVPTEIEAVKMGYKSVTDWYLRAPENNR